MILHLLLKVDYFVYAYTTFNHIMCKITILGIYATPCDKNKNPTENTKKKMLPAA